MLPNKWKVIIIVHDMMSVEHQLLLPHKWNIIALSLRSRIQVGSKGVKSIIVSFRLVASSLVGTFNKEKALL